MGVVTMPRKKQKYEIRWIDHECSDSPTNAHYFVHLSIGVWRCKYCLVGKWYPVGWHQAEAYSERIVRKGLEISYKEEVTKRPEVMRALRILETYRRMQESREDGC